MLLRLSNVSLSSEEWLLLVRFGSWRSLLVKYKSLPRQLLLDNVGHAQEQASAIFLFNYLNILYLGNWVMTLIYPSSNYRVLLGTLN